MSEVPLYPLLDRERNLAAGQIPGEFGAVKTVKAEVWHWLEKKSGESINLLRCSLPARRRLGKQPGTGVPRSSETAHLPRTTESPTDGS